MVPLALYEDWSSKGEEKKAGVYGLQKTRSRNSESDSESVWDLQGSVCWREGWLCSAPYGYREPQISSRYVMFFHDHIILCRRFLCFILIVWGFDVAFSVSGSVFMLNCMKMEPFFLMIRFLWYIFDSAVRSFELNFRFLPAVRFYFYFFYICLELFYIWIH